MASTKKLTREQRKVSKRKARKGLIAAFKGLSRDQKKEFEKKPKGGVKGFLLGTNQERD